MCTTLGEKKRDPVKVSDSDDIELGDLVIYATKWRSDLHDAVGVVVGLQVGLTATSRRTAEVMWSSPTLDRKIASHSVSELIPIRTDAEVAAVMRNRCTKIG